MHATCIRMYILTFQSLETRDSFYFVIQLDHIELRPTCCSDIIVVEQFLIKIFITNFCSHITVLPCHYGGTPAQPP